MSQTDFYLACFGMILLSYLCVIAALIIGWQRICRFLFGWAIRRYVAQRNNKLAALAIFAAMNGDTLTEHYFKEKSKWWRRCEWWGCDR